MTCAEARAEAAAALLTGTTWGDHVAVHLRSCADCRDELVELSGAVALLARSGPEVLPDPVEPDPALLGRLIEEAARRRRGRRRALVLAAAACVAGALALGGGVVVHHDSSRPTGVVATGDARDVATGVSGTARVTSTHSATEVALTASGVAPGTVCTMRVVTRDGRYHAVLTWTAGYVGSASVAGTTTVPATSIMRVDLADGAGAPLVQVPVAAR